MIWSTSNFFNNLLQRHRMILPTQLRLIEFLHANMKNSFDRLLMVIKLKGFYFPAILNLASFDSVHVVQTAENCSGTTAHRE